MMLDGALVSADEALERARVLLLDQRAEAVEAVVREGLRTAPRDHPLQTLLGLALLMQGNDRDGLREFERRPGRTECVARALPYPEWDGPLAGRSLLIWGEQGIGDEIQVVRFVGQLRDAGASRITLACLPECIRAFRNVGADAVISRIGHVSVPKHDCWVAAWSIPYKLGQRLSDLSGEPYLSAHARGAGGIGLVERGNPKHPLDRFRSIPDGLLQGAVPTGTLLEPDGDVQDSLDRLAGLDLLITVDTSWAHMAGALGVPCWLLLSHQGLDWRWLRERSDSPWYRSVRIFRQPAPGDWASVLAEVQSALADR